MDPRLKKTVKIVTLAHVGLLLTLAVVEFFDDPRKPVVVRVSLAASPRQTAPAAPAPDPQSVQPAPQPPAPKPAVPTPQPAPASTPAPKPKPQPTPKPVSQTAPKPAPAKPSWKPRSASDIRQSTLRKLPAANSPQPVSRSVDTTRLERMASGLRAEAGRLSGSTTDGHPPNSQVQHYLALVSSQLYQAWSQPGRQEVPGPNPVVRVNFRIASSGRVLSAGIEQRSGSRAMDKSVASLLISTHSLPPFSQAGLNRNELSVHIDFQLD